MPRFRVMLRCDAIEMLVEDKLADVCFFTTRVADAATPEAAVAMAIASVHVDLSQRVTQDVSSISLKVESIDIVPWWWRRLRPPAGFTFGMVDPNARDILPDQDN